MLEKGINKKMLAERCGWSQSNLYNKMKQDNFSEEELIRISEALDCDLEIRFIDRTEERIPARTGEYIKKSKI